MYAGFFHFSVDREERVTILESEIDFFEVQTDHDQSDCNYTYMF